MTKGQAYHKKYFFENDQWQRDKHITKTIYKMRFKTKV